MCETKSELEQIVAEYRTTKSILDELNEQEKALEREIIGYLDFNHLLSESGTNFTVKVSTCERRSLDSKKLEDTFGSLEDFQRVSQYRRLYVR